MPVSFHHNKLESIGDQLTAGLEVNEIAAHEKCSVRTVYRIQRRLHITGSATPLLPRLKTGRTRMITPEIEEVWFPSQFYAKITNLWLRISLASSHKIPRFTSRKSLIRSKRYTIYVLVYQWSVDSSRNGVWRARWFEFLCKFSYELCYLLIDSKASSGEKFPATRCLESEVATVEGTSTCVPWWVCGQWDHTVATQRLGADRRDCFCDMAI